MAAESNLLCNFTQLIISNFNYCSRGIDVVRNKIKMFAQQKVTLPKGRHKIIILDEADRYVGFSLDISYYVKCVASILSAELLSWTVLDVSIRLSKYQEINMH